MGNWKSFILYHEVNDECEKKEIKKACIEIGKIIQNQSKLSQLWSDVLCEAYDWVHIDFTHFEEHLKNVNYVIVLLDNEFFTDLKEYVKNRFGSDWRQRTDYDGEIDYADDKLRIRYKELKFLFDKKREDSTVTIIPILYNHKGYAQDTIDDLKLMSRKRLIDPGFPVLVPMSNTFKIFSTEIPFTTEKKTAFVKYCWERMGTEPELDPETIKNDLRLCADTVEIKIKPSNGGDDDNAYRIDSSIIYDPFANQQKGSLNMPTGPFISYHLYKTFTDYCDRLGLTNDVVFWDVFLTGESKDYFSICAVAFGTLILHYGLKKDLGLTPEMDGEAREWYKTRIQQGINMLVALRDPYTKTWPTSWFFDNKKPYGVIGTVNQTTLSVSALLSCGFLSPDSGESYETLFNRFRFVWESVKVILENAGRGTRARGDAAWSYMINPNAESQVVTTVFAFDMFVKTRNAIKNLSDRLDSESVKNRNEINNSFQNALNQIDEKINKVVRFFSTAVDTRTNFVANHFADNASLGIRESKTHLAYVLNSLTNFIAKTDDIPEQIRKEAEHTIGTCKDLLLDLFCVRDSFNDGELYERFEDRRAVAGKPEIVAPPNLNAFFETSSDELNYEHCAELIVAEAFLKISENETDPDKKKKAWSNAEKLITKFQERVHCGHSISIMRRNDQVSPSTPIYYLYYYRMVLNDYWKLVYEQKKGDK